jgi:putative peptidoglycan lipid II flippase
LSEAVKEGRRPPGMLRAAGWVSALTLVSRVLGLVREQVFALLLGASLAADAFQVGFRIPNLLRDLFAEGALSAAFVPTYARTLAQGGREQANRLASRLLTLLGLVLAFVVVLGIVEARAIVAVLAPGFEQVAGKVDLTVHLTRVMFPFLPLVSFAAVAMGMLNAEERYSFPAFAPAMFNVVAIGWGLALWGMGLPAEQLALGWAVGTLAGGAAQFLVQVPALRRQGWRFVPEWAPGDPALRQIGRLMAPATMGLAAVQVNIFVNSYFASHEPGAVSWLNYAFRILYLPIGLFGVAVGTIATTGLARRAAEGDLEGLRQTLRRALRLLAFLTIPAMVGLLVLAQPIVALLYERGRFTPFDTAQTASALLFYGAGLAAYTSVKVLAPAFYALGTPRVPLLASLSSVGANLLVNAALYERFGFRSVALGTALGAVVNALILAASFERRLGGLRRQGLGRALGSMAGAALLMGVLAWASAHALQGAVASPGLLGKALIALVPTLLGVLAYLALARAFRIPEAGELIELLRRRS